LQERENEIIFV